MQFKKQNISCAHDAPVYSFLSTPPTSSLERTVIFLKYISLCFPTYIGILQHHICLGVF